MLSDSRIFWLCAADWILIPDSEAAASPIS
jgi:hypothetical protein